jgi:hypothetical protein
MAIWYIFPVLVRFRNKNLATLVQSKENKWGKIGFGCIKVVCYCLQVHSSLKKDEIGVCAAFINPFGTLFMDPTRVARCFNEAL